MRQAVHEKKSTPYDKLRLDIVSFWDKIFRFVCFLTEKLKGILINPDNKAFLLTPSV